jgi:hypothetical protein
VLKGNTFIRYKTGLMIRALIISTARFARHFGKRWFASESQKPFILAGMHLSSSV